jgi:hypothetical protein
MSARAAAMVIKNAPEQTSFFIVGEGFTLAYTVLTL